MVMPILSVTRDVRSREIELRATTLASLRTTASTPAVHRMSANTLVAGLTLLVIQVVLLLLLMLMSFATGNAQTRPQVILQPALISGTIVGSDGKPMAHADVVLRAVLSQDPDGAPEIARASANARGEFAIATTYRGGVTLGMFGTDHQVKSVGLQLSPGFQLQVNARLARVQYSTSFDSIRVAGDFNNFRTDTSARLLQARADGTFALDIPVRADSLSYVLVRLAQRSSTNGVSSDEQVFTGSGYRSVARTNGGFAHIAVDPRQIVRDTNPARVQYAGGAEARAARLSDTIRAHSVLHEKLTANSPRTDPAIWAAAVNRARHDLANEQTPMVREMLLLELMQLAQMGAAVPRSIGRQALAEMGPASGAWITLESLRDYLPFIPQWVADSVVHLMRPVPAQTMSPTDSSRVRASVARIVARFDSAAARASNESTQANWMFLSAAASAKWLPKRTAETLSRMQAQYPTRMSTRMASSQWGTQQVLRKSAALPPIGFAALHDSNSRITNTQIAGKFVLIDFWATWCSPCIGEMSYLHDAYKTFHDSGFEILSITANDNMADVDSFRVKRWAMPWMHGVATGGLDGAQMRDLEIYGIPRAVLVGPDGKIVATDQELRGAALGATLRRVLARPGPG